MTSSPLVSTTVYISWRVSTRGQREPKTSSSGVGGGGGGVTTQSLVCCVGSVEAGCSLLAPADNLMFARTPPTVGAFRCAQTFGAKGRLILSRAEASIRHRAPILAVGRFSIDYLKTQKNITLHSIEPRASRRRSITTICLFCIFQPGHVSGCGAPHSPRKLWKCFYFFQSGTNVNVSSGESLPTLCAGVIIIA